MSLINLMPVFSGTFYVEVPEADVKVLCGIPADTVKKLIQLRIIRPTELNGVPFETGPNAILLSDNSIQNGQLSNLTEFPILQMLYRQGMLIPNHPNNKNIRPILMGQPSQLISQMDYINLGNYGIDNLPEMAEAGIQEDEAREILRIKKRFAFGKFKSPEELIDFRPLSHDNPVEIRNGVFVRRLSTNVFEFTYKDEKKVVDMNLKPGEYYEIPYPLGYYDVERGFFSVVHSGQGDGWDTNRSCMSSVIVHRGKVYLVDAGPNVNHILRALGIGLNELMGVFLTHVHDDHFNGIASLTTLEHRLDIFTTPLVRRCVTKKLSSLLSLDQLFFSDFFNFIDLRPGEWNGVENLEVMPQFSPHPIETYNFYFRCISAQGYKTYAHLADTTSFSVLDSMIEDDPEKPGISSAMAKKVKENYLMSADLKKVDVGGGMIHGDAHDYKDDPSAKIVFAHTSSPILDREKLVFGSEAHFGAVDVLIDTHYDFLRENAKSIVERYFEMIRPNALQHLLNNPIIKFYPGSIIYKQGQKMDHVYLILTGMVSRVKNDASKFGVVGMGDFVGEGIMNGTKYAMVTHRADTFVNALAIPASLIENLIEKHKVGETLVASENYRNLLLLSPLFKQNISCHHLNLITKTIKLVEFNEEHTKEKSFTELVSEMGRQRFVFVLLKGKIAMGTLAAPKMFEFETGDFFGESVIYGFMEVFSYQLLEPCVLCLIPYNRINSIPCVFQKLLERYEKNFNHLITQTEKTPQTLEFNPEKYNTDIQSVNAANQKLLSLFNMVVYFRYIKDPVSGLGALKNIGSYFKSYSDIKQSCLLMYRNREFKKIRSNHKDFMAELSAIVSNSEKNRSLSEKDKEKLKSLVLASIQEISRFRDRET